MHAAIYALAEQALASLAPGYSVVEPRKELPFSNWDYPAMATLANGIVIICGGEHTFPDRTDTVYAYNPATDIYTSRARMNVKRYRLGACRFGGESANQIIAVGGFNGSNSSAVEVYDYTSNTWTRKANMLNNRRNVDVAHRRTSDRYIVPGGHYYSSNSTTWRDVQMYNPSTNTWSLTLSLAYCVHSYGLTTLPDGDVLLVGGLGSDYGTGDSWPDDYDQPLNICRKFTGNSWTSMASLPISAYGLGLATAGDGLVYAFYEKSILRFDPTANLWTTAFTHSENMSPSNADTLPDGNIAVIHLTGEKMWIVVPDTNAVVRRTLQTIKALAAIA